MDDLQELCSLMTGSYKTGQIFSSLKNLRIENFFSKVLVKKIEFIHW